MAEAEILPPETTERQSDLEDGLEDIQVKTAHARAYKARLVTTGNIKTELGKIYRAFRNGKITAQEAAISEKILRTMLKATEQEHEFLLKTEDPEDDRPGLAGVVLIGPSGNKADGDPVLQSIIEEAVEKYSTAQQKGKSNGKDRSSK